MTGGGAQCNRAIMLITDGAPDPYEDIFAKYNWPNKDVRTSHVYSIDLSSLFCPFARQKEDRVV